MFSIVVFILCVFQRQGLYFIFNRSLRVKNAGKARRASIGHFCWQTPLTSLNNSTHWRDFHSLRPTEHSTDSTDAHTQTLKAFMRPDYKIIMSFQKSQEEKSDRLDLNRSWNYYFITKYHSSEFRDGCIRTCRNRLNFKYVCLFS